MSGGDLLGEAVAELYSADPDGFIGRRAELAGQARAAGQVPAARQIASLRKPTKSAWVINQLARAVPDSVAELTTLGEQLRAAERTGDGAKMRELSQQRRRLIASLVRQALAVSDQTAAPAALREEITATFAAALADPEIAEEIRQGRLLRSASRPGFGSGQATLALVPPLSDAGKADAGKADAGKADAGKADAGKAKATPAPSPSTRGEPPGTGQAPRPAPSTRRSSGAASAAKERQDKLALAAERRAARLAEAAARAEAQAQERRTKARAAAEQALADADQAAATATQNEQDQADTVRRLEHELADARHRLRMAAAEVRRTEAAQHKARQALDRLAD